MRFSLSGLFRRVNIYKSFGKEYSKVSCSCQFVLRGKGQVVFSNKGRLALGWPKTGFDNDQKIILNIHGKLTIEGKVEIASGCSIDLTSEQANCIIKESYINPNTKIIISDYLVIGNGCAISWNCQLLDDDFHAIFYEGRKDSLKGIEIGNHVWLGSNVNIYKGTRIADGCVVASDSSVKGIFSEPNCLIAGNPAKVLKRQIQWT